MKYLIYGILRGALISTCHLALISIGVCLVKGGFDLELFRLISVCCCLAAPVNLISAELRDVSGPIHPILHLRIEQKPENMACLVCGFLSALSTPILYLTVVENLSPENSQMLTFVVGGLVFLGSILLDWLCKWARARVLRDWNCGRYGGLT